MSDAIREGIYTRLAGDSILTDLITTYLEQPAIFDRDPAPENAELPYLILGAIINNEGWDTKTSKGREYSMDINTYDSESGNSRTAFEIANRIRSLFHRKPDELSIDGFTVRTVTINGPYDIGRVLGMESYHVMTTVNMMLTENESQ